MCFLLTPFPYGKVDLQAINVVIQYPQFLLLAEPMAARYFWLDCSQGISAGHVSDTRPLAQLKFRLPTRSRAVLFYQGEMLTQRNATKPLSIKRIRNENFRCL